MLLILAAFFLSFYVYLNSYIIKNTQVHRVNNIISIFRKQYYIFFVRHSSIAALYHNTKQIRMNF